MGSFHNIVNVSPMLHWSSYIKKASPLGEAGLQTDPQNRHCEDRALALAVAIHGVSDRPWIASLALAIDP